MIKSPDRRLAIVVVPLLTLAVAACGGGGGGHGDHGSSAGSKAPTRTVDVAMVDNDFDPSSVQVAEGETVRFVFHNAGTGVHDAFIGDAAAQEAHEMQMRGMASGHGEHGPTGVEVPPGGTAELTYTFDKSGQLEVGCHEPGHYANGMKIDVTVS